ncbi:hypothetical protein ACGFIR_03880 [Micromonospora sp. NPDC049051]|uniref:hypothetical protein n=1 Tax=Micromonospora sp. NPDC049051 TaxID=3364264 RepID=UPI00372098A3
MRTTVTATRGARLLLLVGTLLGLAAMHTIGHDSHPTGHAPAPSGHAAASAPHAALAPGRQVVLAPVPHAAPALAPHADGALAPPPQDVALHAGGAALHAVGAALGAVVDCPGGCAAGQLLPSGGAGGELPGWGVCLAVLGAFAASLLLLAALLSARVRAVGPVGGGPVGCVLPPRAPPPRPVGLRLATVSVLRR